MINSIKNLRQYQYFKFFYGKLKWRLPFLLFIAAIVAVLDGIGLTMFIPLFQVIESGNASPADLGKLGFVIEFLNSIGLQLKLSIVLIMLVSLFALKGLVEFFEMYISSKFQLRYIQQLRIGLLAGLCNVAYLNFTKIDLGRIQNGITNEIEKASTALYSFMFTAKSGIMLVGYLSLAFAANLRFAIIISVVGVIGGFIYRKTNKTVEVSSLKQSSIANGFQGKFMELLMNYKYLKATDLISQYRKTLFDDISAVESLNMKVGKINAITNALKDPISITLIATIIFIQVIIFKVSVFSIVLSLVFFYRSLTSLISLQNTWQGFLAYSGSIHIIKNLSSEFDESLESPVHEAIPELKSEIRMANVSFSFGKDAPDVLQDVSLRIRKNSIVAFVGESGSGKTTIVNILAGLIFPEQGKIFIDDEVLSKLSVRDYRKYIGYITQEPVVFNDTLYNNVTFGASKTPENLERFFEIMEQTALYGFVKNLPGKEDAMVGDNGVLISGGQKQRISIARELYRGAKILFMDEATSSLDSETEDVILKTIDALKGKYTIVLIAHRLSTVKNADVIFLLENGTISASGNFETLLKESTVFTKMVKSQGF